MTKVGGGRYTLISSVVIIFSSSSSSSSSSYKPDSSITNARPDLIVCRFKPVIDKQIMNTNSNLWSAEYNGMPSSVANSHHQDFLPFSHRYLVHEQFQ